MKYLEHLLGICGDNWHPNLIHIVLLISIGLIIKKIYEEIYNVG